jgi:hypothetical protein
MRKQIIKVQWNKAERDVYEICTTDTQKWPEKMNMLQNKHFKYVDNSLLICNVVWVWEVLTTTKGSSVLLGNNAICLQVHEALQLRRSTWTSTPPWKPRIINFVNHKLIGKGNTGSCEVHMRNEHEFLLHQRRRLQRSNGGYIFPVSVKLWRNGTKEQETVLCTSI